MSHYKLSVVMVVASFLGAGCATPEPAAPESVVGHWRFERITGVAVLPDRAPTVSFAADGKMSGSAGCNRFVGSYSATGHELAVSDAGVTRMMCEPPLMEQEQRALAALRGAERFEFDGAALLLYSKAAAEPSRLVANTTN